MKQSILTKLRMNEEDSQPGCSKEVDDSLKNWSKEEKFELLQALKARGSHDLRGIQLSYLPEKTTSEIENAIAFYKEKADKSVYNDRKKKEAKQEAVNINASLPLSNWARLLVESIGFEGLQTEVATALRIIAEFEDIPAAVLTENIDFKKAYHLLANAVEGKALQDEKYISALLNKSILETILTSKAFIRITTLQQVLNSIAVSEKVTTSFFKPEFKSAEDAAINRLCEQKNYNPLNISENCMKPSAH